jgi:predicted nuclease of restriction endonuclease-like (RecB) superfamily
MPVVFTQLVERCVGVCVLWVNVVKLRCFVCVEMKRGKYYSSLLVTCE